MKRENARQAFRSMSHVCWVLAAKVGVCSLNLWNRVTQLNTRNFRFSERINRFCLSLFYVQITGLCFYCVSRTKRYVYIYIFMYWIIWHSKHHFAFYSEYILFHSVIRPTTHHKHQHWWITARTIDGKTDALNRTDERTSGRKIWIMLIALLLLWFVLWLGAEYSLRILLLYCNRHRVRYYES